MGDWQPLPNGSFTERPWRDIPVGATVNQEPLHWSLGCYTIGSDLDAAPKAGAGDTHDLALTIPECVHKLEHQLPPSERRFLADGTPNPDRLIYDLEADTVYKVFSSANPFGVFLSGEMELTPRRVVEFRVPVRVHAHGNGDTGAAYWRALSGHGGTPWLTFKRDFADRTWHVGAFDVMVPDDGLLFYTVQMESHTIGGIDFFLSGLQWRYAGLPPVTCRGLPRVDYKRTVNVIPETATDERAVEIFLEGWRRSKESAGVSTDDGGIGDLSDKTARLYDLSDAERQTMRDWYAEEYPGTKVEFAGTSGGGEPPTPPTSPTPPAEYPYPVAAKGSKLSPHDSGGTGMSRKWALDAVSAGAPLATIKAIERIGWLREIKRLSPTTQTVARFLRGIGDYNVEGPPLDGNLKDTARQVMDSLLPRWDEHREYVDWWEIVNEPDPPGPDGHRREAELMIECGEIAAREGYHVALFSYPTGVPEWEEMQAVVETGVFAEAKRHGHAFALHEYGSKRWFGTGLPGQPQYPDRGALAVRYRWWYEDFLKPRGEVIPLLLTEVALRLFDSDPWARDMTSEEFLAELAWYDKLLREDYYVIGAHIFTLGAVGGTWKDLNFDQHVPTMTQYVIAEWNKDNALPPASHVPVVPPQPPVIPVPPTPQPPTLTSPPLLGFNDPNNAGAAHWMRGEGLTGLAVIPLFIGGNAAALDFSEYEAAGLRVIVNLRLSYATDDGGAGTLPLFGSPDWAQFVDAAVATINNARGVWGWEIGNEANNPREFPHAGPLTPKQVADTYNAIRYVCPGKRMSPGSLDPFNAQAGDPRDWLTTIYNGIGGAEFIAVHGYTHGVGNVGNDQRFTDDPLKWQGYHYPLCITALLESLPSAYKGLPVYVTESNHIHKDDGSRGWVSDARAGDWVYEAYDAAWIEGFAGLALYRWEGDAWTVRHNPYILATMKELAR